MSLTYVCIMAGGSGERFWPVSRVQKPKHLVPLLSEGTLLEATVRRVALVVPWQNIFILTNSVQIQACRALLPELAEAQFIAEPAKRDTAAACALGTALVHRVQPGAVVAFLPADALVRNTQVFAEQLAQVGAVAEGNDAFGMIGVKPQSPATRFGYLQKGENLPKPPGFFHVKRFVEKPDEATAQGYLAQGDYLWNAGVFAWKTTTFLAEAQQLQPELARFIEHFPKEESAQHDYLAHEFVRLPKISLDYAIMEKAQRVIGTEARFDWDDVGSWSALPAHLPKDTEGNAAIGQAIFYDAKNNMVLTGKKRVVALCGVSDLVVIETDDAILVCHRDAAERIKHLQPQLPLELR